MGEVPAKSTELIDRIISRMIGPGVVDISNVDNEMLVLMNQARAQHNIAPLKPHPALLKAVIAHAQDMAIHNRLSHYGLAVYSTWADRCENAGYPGASLMTINENVAGGQISAQMVINDYSQSSGHWAAIMDPRAQHVASAAATGSRGWTYWDTVFGWGAPDSEIVHTIDYLLV